MGPLGWSLRCQRRDSAGSNPACAAKMGSSSNGKTPGLHPGNEGSTPSESTKQRASETDNHAGLISREIQGSTPWSATNSVPSASGSAPGLHPAPSGFEPLGTDHLRSEASARASA